MGGNNSEEYDAISACVQLEGDNTTASSVQSAGDYSTVDSVQSEGDNTIVGSVQPVWAYTTTGLEQWNKTLPGIALGFSFSSVGTGVGSRSKEPTTRSASSRIYYSQVKSRNKGLTIMLIISVFL